MGLCNPMINIKYLVYNKKKRGQFDVVKPKLSSAAALGSGGLAGGTCGPGGAPAGPCSPEAFGGLPNPAGATLALAAGVSGHLVGGLTACCLSWRLSLKPAVGSAWDCAVQFGSYECQLWVCHDQPCHPAHCDDLPWSWPDMAVTE